MDSVHRVNTSAVVDGAVILMNITSEPLLAGWDTSNSSANTGSLFSTLLNDTVAQVLSTPKHYAAIRVDADDGSTAGGLRLYSMAQCAPDMVEDICYNCLSNFSDLAMANFAGRQGGRVLGLRCNLRYDTSKFYAGEPTWSSGTTDSIAPRAPPQPAPPRSPSPKHKSKQKINAPVY
ncbi:cysteine-rich receptor-like protein kinase 15 [Panicum miliaceum]|uniref:Cysteine-rich receptor-like protein kinase 15 n=1 Tax=Panicum miliaceum TaxID=4540 RepID=A0A3L6PLA7_PANMI|nr:cysteine-rich receptor-like protein kinase 15 [Panicum miliaceum]